MFEEVTYQRYVIFWELELTISDKESCSSMHWVCGEKEVFSSLRIFRSGKKISDKKSYFSIYWARGEKKEVFASLRIFR